MSLIKFVLSFFFCVLGVFMAIAFVCYFVNPAALTQTAIYIWAAFAVILSCWLYS